MVGIYQIVNKVNGKRYVGQSINTRKRKSEHFYRLRKNIHRNPRLQHAVHIYGIDNFEFRVLLCCDKENLTLYEQACVDKLQPEYNIQRECVVSSLGVKQSEETILKRVAHIRGVPLTDEHKRKLSQAKLGKARTKEARKNMSEAAKKQKRKPSRLAIENSKRSNAKVFPGMVSPDGVVYSNIKNLSQFCREHGLPYNQIYQLCKNNDTHKTAHGWTHINNPNPEKKASNAKKHPSVISPDGIVYEVFNASKFARDHGLNTGFSGLLHGRVKTYRGWRKAENVSNK